ncbi:MAG TPA: amidohydrolase family protein [Acidimicrobiia bacterium]|nr:amidohydrolase family protein [Acidimicrobiia bacterium]
MMFHDHHFHPLGYSQMVTGLELMDSVDIAEVKTRVASRTEQTTGAVIGQRLNDEGLAELRLPTRFDLDEAVPTRPVVLYRYCGHIAVANTAALKLAGIDADTPDPPGGAFDRDRTGFPTGVLRETALLVIGNAIAPLAEPPSDADVLDALAGLLDYGLGSVTGMVSATEPIWCGVGDELETLCRLAPDLPLDIDVYVITENPGDLVSAAQRLTEADGRLRFSGWKGFSDGSFGGHTAAMYEPFSDRPDTTGTLRLSLRQALTMADASLDIGGGVAVHAIGDRANDVVLDLFQSLIGDGADPSKLRVEHASLLTEAGIERMARLGVTASVQPAFLASEASWLHKRLGDERMQRVYPFHTLQEAGIPLLGGSDSPVELPDPEVGIRAAVQRHGFSPAETLTVEQANALFAPPSH